MLPSNSKILGSVVGEEDRAQSSPHLLTLAVGGQEAVQLQE